MKTSIVTEVESIGPKTAHAYLAKAAPNRTIRKSVVDRYAKAMTSGAWETTHQGIAFDEAGMLIDGQHRLTAIIQSNKTIKIQVSRYECAAPMSVLDSGSSRNVSDRVQIAGFIPEHTAMTISILTAMLIAETGVVNGNGLQAHELSHLYDQEMSSIRFTLTAFGTKQSKQWNSVIRAAFAYCVEFAPKEVAELATYLRDKVGYKRGSAAHTLVMALADGRLQAKCSQERIDTMAKCLWLIRAHIEGKPVERVKSTAAIFNWAARQRQSKNRLLAPLLK